MKNILTLNGQYCAVELIASGSSVFVFVLSTILHSGFLDFTSTPLLKGYELLHLAAINALLGVLPLLFQIDSYPQWALFFNLNMFKVMEFFLVFWYFWYNYIFFNHHQLVQVDNKWLVFERVYKWEHLKNKPWFFFFSFGCNDNFELWCLDNWGCEVMASDNWRIAIWFF